LGFAPKTEEDCRIIGRICRNYIKFQEWQEYRSFNSFQEKYGLKKLSKDDIEWLNFFLKMQKELIQIIKNKQ